MRCYDCEYSNKWVTANAYCNKIGRTVFIDNDSKETGCGIEDE